MAWTISKPLGLHAGVRASAAGGATTHTPAAAYHTS